MRNIFNYALPQSQAFTSTGQNIIGSGLSDLSTAGNYFKKLLGGSRSDMLQAVAPESEAVHSQADAERRQLAASGTSRGGGVNAVSQQAKDTEMSKIDQLLFGVRPGAAKEVADIGGKTAAIGTSELSAALQALGIGETSAADLGNLATGSRAQSMQANAAAGASAASLLTGIFGLL